MALKQLILNKKIKERSNELEKVKVKRSEFQKKEAELKRALDEAETEEDIATVSESAEQLEKDIQAIDDEIADLEKEKQELEDELAQVEDSGKDNSNGSGEERNMKKIKVTEEELETKRSAINAFVKSKGTEKRDGFTSVEGGALIPEELLQPQLTPEDVVDLTKYVRLVSVNSGSGKFPVISKAGSKMLTVKELEKNPKLANPTMKEVDYSVATRRGYIPLSQEVIDDATYDVTALIADEIQDQALNTKNADIAAILQTAPAKAVTGVDGLKDLVNKDIKKVYDVKYIISASMYAELDKLKDKNGRYLLQDSITAASGKQLLGREVVVLDDVVIGKKAGDIVGFVGDAKAFAAFFDRKQVSVKWVDNDIYGQLLAGVIRYDVKATDTAAGYFVTFTPETTTTE
ncbi:MULTISPECIES: phage major capsid protein [unclassified Lactococcus]|uniref:phage major capsid protein n=1 Tax=unclassified Lactococcus TaxID=2643510 RepID=UPI0011C871E5|nr:MULTISPECIES: phage major capsid protein [unclassified Lactococcus]MQW22949.1 phage major capsid protein [Lactococcus sp. dk101]TXK44504.1 phage major capsid protein [Lactococcus sp. dk310]TXK50357.1 phage major capsid protein [Lactococcus sp. dk322]